MILDTGICTLFQCVDMAAPGEMPYPAYQILGKSWFRELSFETSPVQPTEGRKEKRTDNRIRILQDRRIRENRDLVILRDLDAFADRETTDTVYRITRAFHGTDEDSPAAITDLSLEVMKP